MYKALVSFSGAISMRKGEVKSITDKTIIADLLRAGYIEEAKSVKVKTAEKPEPKKETAEKPKTAKTKQPRKRTAKK